MRLKIVRFGGDAKSSAQTGNASAPFISAESTTHSDRQRSLRRPRSLCAPLGRKNCAQKISLLLCQRLKVGQRGVDVNQGLRRQPQQLNRAGRVVPANTVARLTARAYPASVLVFRARVPRNAPSLFPASISHLRSSLRRFRETLPSR